jgi:RHS repeat-associated protein
MKTIMFRLALLLLVLTSGAPLRATEKFRATTTIDSLPGRYVVALSEETAVGDAATLAATLAGTYGVRLEPYAAEGFRGFAVVGMPSRVRLLSSDPRVAWVDEQTAASVSKPPIQTDSTPYVWKSAYRYDDTGNIIGIDRYGADGIGVAGSDYYVYDGVNRLVAATADTESSKNTAQYQYDRWGNLLTLSLTGSTESVARSFGVDPLSNRLDKPCSGQVSCYMAGYDNAGNVTSFSTTNYKWDALGMMTELNTLSRHEFYIYDASNERIATLVLPPGGTQPQQYRYTLRGFDQKVLRELVHDVAPTDAWTWKKDYVYRGGALLASIERSPTGAEQRLHYHLDHLGTPRMITSDSGVRVALETLWPFGGEAPGTQPRPGERLKFTGHERDSGGSTGIDLDYMHARYYSAMAGRFLSVDPGKDWDIHQPQSWNMYSYVRNNPVNRVDLTGKWTTAIHEKLIDLAFPGLPNSERYILKNASLRVDNPLTGQFPRTAYQHSMRAKGETVGQAMQKSAAFYDKKISEARTQNADAQAHARDGTGRSEAMKMASLQSVGEAMHMVADASSPQHKGYQVWAPVADPIASLQHPSGETKIDPVTQNIVVQQLRAVYGTVFGDEQLQRATTREQQ